MLNILLKMNHLNDPFKSTLLFKTAANTRSLFASKNSKKTETVSVVETQRLKTQRQGKLKILGHFDKS